VVLLGLMLLVPLTSWILNTTFSDAIGSSFFTFKVLGQFTGIVGCQLFAFALILSARLAFLEKFFGGMDKLYVIHHKVGTIAFSFLAFHPLLLALRFVGESFAEAADFLNPFGNTLPVILGICSIVMMLALLFLTFYGSVFSYPALKTAHRFLGLAFFLGFLHVLLIPSSLSSDSVLKISLLTSAGLGLIAYTYRTLLGSFVVPRTAFTVSQVKDLGGQMTEITLSPVGKGMLHVPGQFGMLTFVNSRTVKNEEHPFTISSPGLDGTVRFSVKALGDFTTLLPSLTVGTRALVEGPFGQFSYIYGSPKQVWIAGGIGVTPFVSMAEHMLTLDTLPYIIDFYYSTRTSADGVYHEVFESLAKKHSTFFYHFMPSDTSGFVSAEVVSKDCTDVTSRDIFICGPPGMMAALTTQFITSGVSESHIHTERFALLK
jgi:predicted ferric reductase